MKRLLRKPISTAAFAAIVSIGTLLLYNIPFFSYVARNSNEGDGGRLLLMASLAVVMLAVNFMMTALILRGIGILQLDALGVHPGSRRATRPVLSAPASGL